MEFQESQMVCDVRGPQVLTGLGGDWRFPSLSPPSLGLPGLQTPRLRFHSPVQEGCTPQL